MTLGVYSILHLMYVHIVQTEFPADGEENHYRQVPSRPRLQIRDTDMNS